MYLLQLLFVLSYTNIEFARMLLDALLNVLLTFGVHCPLVSTFHPYLHLTVLSGVLISLVL